MIVSGSSQNYHRGRRPDQETIRIPFGIRSVAVIDNLAQRRETNA